MRGTFACPECRSVITPPEHGPILKVRCPECSTLVELPYLRRRESQRRRESASGWAWVAIVLALAVIATVGTYVAVRSRIRAERLQVFEDLIEAAAEDERADRFSTAVNRLSTAIRMGTNEGFADAVRLGELERRRGQLLAQDENARASDIEARARADITAAAALARQGPAELPRVLDLCESSYSLAGRSKSEAAAQTREQARQLATRLIQERGIVFELGVGSFLDDQRGGEPHLQRLKPILGPHLAAHGYLPRRDESVLSELWDVVAPYRIRVLVSESRPGTYLQSALRTCRIDTTLELVRGESLLWRNRVSGQTRAPSPRMSAFQSRVLASARKQDPDLERLLYDDAFIYMLDQLPSRLANFPNWRPVS